LIQAQLESGRLRFTTREEAVAGNEVVWITFDTPVDENDVADTEFVFERAARLLPLLSPGAVMLISSQMPMGSVARLEERYRALAPGNGVRFACAPENLRSGKAIEVFQNPDRVVVGIRSPEDKQRLASLWQPFHAQIEWMSVESAEMTKHAINAFLATSVAFINEIARICEQAGADAGEVERGLKSDLRIGRRAYLHPGAAFAGGTLARDIHFLRDRASRSGIDAALLEGVKRSNDIHQGWLARRFTECTGGARGRHVAVLGLTYKPGTSTLRRSGALAICRWLSAEGASVAAYDPGVTKGEEGIPSSIRLADTAAEALEGADALLIATEWPEFRSLTADIVAARMKRPIVLDPAGHLAESLRGDPRIRYYSVGRSA
jgi:UDPglucose 6-dehydrogenase